MSLAAAPDLIERVVGFRAWRVIDDRLLSPYIPCRWKGRTMHAECWPANRSLTKGRGWLNRPHPVPHADCQCGIYAYHRPGARAYYGEFEWVEGVVSAWGRVVSHHDGFRAEHARIEALALSGGQRRRDRARAVAERLEVPLVEPGELPAAAAAAGAPLPAALIP